jgi:tetratricopeptide (TPR) repeat protein
MAHYNLGTHFYSAQLNLEAAASFERASQISAVSESVPRLYTGDALVRAGQARLEAGQPTEALADFERSIPFYESSIEADGVTANVASARIASAHRDRGRALVRLGDNPAALVALRTAVTTWDRGLTQTELSPTRVGSVRQSVGEVYLLLAEVFHLLQQPDSAGYYRARAATLSSP